MKKIKKPVSILLVFMMIVSLFAVVPITASAAEETITVHSNTDKLSNHGIQNLQYGEHLDFDGTGLPWGTFVAPPGKVFTKIVSNGANRGAINWTGSADRVNHDNMGGEWYIDWDTDEEGFRPFTISFTLADAITTYTVTWKNGETVLKTDTVEEGTAPAYSGDVPTKAEDENNTYTFSGWTDGTNTYGATDTLPAVAGDITYTATYTASAKSAKTIAAGETYYIGDSIAFTDAPPFVYVRYDDDTYGDYTAYLIGGDNTTVTAPTYDSRGGQWKFNDVLRYEPWASARPLRITDTNDRTPIGFKCSGGTGTSSDPFTFECVYESAPELFPQHSVSLGGDIGVNFYIDPAAANANENAAVSVDFSWNGQTKTVVAEYDDGKGLFRATCDVVAAEVACDITAVATVNGEKQTQTDTYSVQDYAEAVYNNPTAYDTKGRPDKLQALAKALLNYGAMAQTVFVEYMKQPVKAPADIVKTVEKTNFNTISADDIAGEATDLNAIATDLGFKYYTSSVFYLQNNTLRLYFTPNTYQDAMPHVDDFKGNQSEYYYYVEKENIAAAELDEQQSFTIGDKTFTFSALDYAKAVVNSGMGGNQKDLAKALYLYNKAANEYFEDAPAPVENVVDLSALQGDYEAKDGDVLSGTVTGDKKITIADGATVTLKDANITLSTDAEYAGITPLGDATIILEGVNYVKGGGERYPAIFAPAGYTLTIDGSGSLTATGTDYSAAIGGGESNAGKIVINGGTIIANGGSYGAGIGSGGENSSCGDITINGGTVKATGGSSGAGIGSGAYDASCGNITINGGTVTAKGGSYAAGIGSGASYSSCGKITISANVTLVTAIKGQGANSIGAGYYDSSCGTVTIEDNSKVTQN